jgi:hypothetical protein
VIRFSCPSRKFAAAHQVRASTSVKICCRHARKRLRKWSDSSRARRIAQAHGSSPGPNPHSSRPMPWLRAD